MKQHAEMRLFVKDVAGKQQSLFFFDAMVDIAMPSPCTSSSPPRSLGQGISVAYLRTKTCSDTSPETHFPRGIMRPTDKATVDSRSVQSFAVIKNTAAVGRFHTRARNGSSV